MTYYVMWISNGALQVNEITEFNDIHGAKVKFCNVWAALENEPTVASAEVVILDQHFEVVDGCHQKVTHEPQE